ncbi:MAG: bifunctional riboflavin kinase/FMN adenylyltransferase [Armatimonadia bacterium]
MRVIEGIENLPLPDQPRAVCVGALDGFHVGHQYLLSRLCALANERDLESAIVTFEPIPAQFFAPPTAPPRRLVTRDERIALAESLCCDLMVILRFDAEVAGWTAERFMQDVLLGGMHARVMMASSNHAMGHDHADMAAMAGIARRIGLECIEVPLLQLGSFSVSSSQVRQLLWEGRVEEATALLGRHYCLVGEVVGGRGIARELGFPTANLVPPPEKLIPGDGVYAGIAQVESEVGNAPAPHAVWAAAISVGNAPTFDLGKRVIEAHILTEEPIDLTGGKLRLQFVQRLRDQKKFGSPTELAEQIALDVKLTRELCASTARELRRTGVFCSSEKGS